MSSGLSLIRALDESDVDEAARILDKNPDEIALRDNEDRVALHYAAETADSKTFRRILLLDTSFVDCQDQNGYTPLLIASMSGNVEAIEILLEFGAQINHIDKEKHSCVHWAVVCGQLDALILLLEKGANVNASDNQGAQPLHYATITEDVTPERSEAILHVLLKNGAQVNGKDLDERTPILWAASNGNLEAMISLIQAGGDRNAVDRDRLNAMHCAASHGHEHVLSHLIETSDQSIIDATDRNGDTPLFYSVTLGHFECTRLLLNSGADANHQDSRFRTPSHCAAAKGQLRMLKLLKHYGASFEIQNRRGDIPLHEAIQAGSKDVVEWLIALHPSSVNSANYEGRTGLHLAAAAGSMEIVVILCTKNADINPIMLYKGSLYTPLDLAKKRNHELVVEYLTRRHSAKSAEQIPEESQKDWMARLEEQIEKAAENHDLGRMRNEEFDRNFGSSTKPRRRRSHDDIMTQETQTASPESKPVATNTSRCSSRRPSSASPRPLLPKATSTTDLLGSQKGIGLGETQAERDAMNQQIQRIVEEIQRTAIANEEQIRQQNAEQRNKDSQTPSETDVESVIARVKEEEPSEKDRKSKRENSRKTKNRSTRELHTDTTDSKENVSPSRGTTKKLKKKRQSLSANTNGGDENASRKVSTEDDKTSEGQAAENNEASDCDTRLEDAQQLGESFGVLYSTTDESGTDSVAFEELRQKTRKTLRDSSAVPKHRNNCDENNVIHRVKVKTKGKQMSKRYLHEKAIFQELTHLKKMQIQYGKVNERVLVRSLIGNFCKMHDLNPAHFKFQTFYAWEKFLYDQLKLIYIEERERLRNSRPPPSTRFESRLRHARAIPINMRASEVIALSDDRSNSSKSFTKSMTSSATDKRTSSKYARGLHRGSANVGSRRCECLGNHILIK